ncbi:MAG: beta-phosphoglucomutase, partial [Proteobacteria bacterium]|nr:beta-phosphoglucomutase [Pseudomonadota bacterium]
MCLDHDGPSASAAQAETLLALANGLLGVRGGREEQPSATDGAFLASVYERLPIEYHEAFPGFARTSDTRVPVADGKRIRIRVGAGRHDLGTGTRLECRRTLDLRHGRLHRRTLWQAPDGGRLEVTALRVVPLDGRALLGIRLTVRSVDYRGPLVLESCIEAGESARRADDPRIGAAEGAALALGERRLAGEVALLTQRARRSDIHVAVAQAHGAVQPLTYGEALLGDAKAVGQSFSGELAPGAEVTIEKFVAWAAGGPADELAAAAVAAVNAAARAGFGALERENASAWREFWAGAELGIEGDASLDEALRFNLFHLRQSAPADGRHALAAKGLTGEGYEGHVFWDTEVFALPVLQMTAPALVRASLDWRARALPAARRHAREMNHPIGALYPWRTIGGDECSGYFPAGSAQYHINAAVAYALRLHALGQDGKAPSPADASVLFETARIWMQVGHHDAARGGAFCIHSVTGPDEYSALVDNDCYTNRLARLHLLHAAGVADRLRAEAPEQYRALAAELDLLETEPATWRRAAQAMYVPVDPRLGVHPQDDTFLRRPVWTHPSEPADDRPLLLRYHPLTLYRHQVCKQPSVVLADVLLDDGVSAAQKRRDYDYYEPLTVHDSSLSASTWSILAAELGLLDDALRYFREGARLDLDDLHGNAAHGAHMAAMAGSWLALAWGLGGLRIAADGALRLRPVLPAAWQGYHFTLQWRGRVLVVRVTAAGVAYELTRGEALALVHDGRPLTVARGPAVRAPLAAPAVAPARRMADAVIFDLDGVLTDTAELHFRAWSRLAAEIGVPFDRRTNERLKGVDRLSSLGIILERATQAYDAAARAELAARKNAYFVA